MNTLMNIKSVIADVVNNHLQINSFYFDTYDNILSLKDVKYPSLFVVPVSVAVGKKSNDYTFTFVMLDKVDKSNVNDVDILETTRQLMLDVIAVLDRTLSANFRIESQSINLTSVSDKYNDDNVSGWLANVTIYSINELDKCAAAMVNMPVLLAGGDAEYILLE